MDIRTTLLSILFSTSIVLSQNQSNSSSYENGYTNVSSNFHSYQTEVSSTEDAKCEVTGYHEREIYTLSQIPLMTCKCLNDGDKVVCPTWSVFRHNESIMSSLVFGDTWDDYCEATVRFVVPAYEKLRSQVEFTMTCNASDFISMEYNLVIRPSANNEYCYLSGDCVVEHQICTRDRCECRWPKRYSEVYDRCYDPKVIGQSCSVHEECEGKDVRSECDGVCKCKDPYIEGKYGCQYQARKLGQSCTFHEECRASDTLSECNGVCRCQDLYVPLTDKCVYKPSGNNGPCSTDKNCQVWDQYCNSDNKCSCRYPKKYSENYSRCYQPRSLGEACLFDEECEDKDPLSWCFNWCECRFPAFRGIWRCEIEEAGNNGPCISDQHCRIVDQYCNSNSRCSCRSPKKYSESLMRCYEPKNLDQLCSYDEECQDTDPNSECLGFCHCKSPSVRGKNGCEIKDLQSGNNEPCNSNRDCIIQDQYCTQGRCSCWLPKKYDERYKKCYAQTGNNGPCETDQYCKLQDQYCNLVARKCSCPSPKVYSEANGRCLDRKYLGQPCTLDDECKLRDSLSRCKDVCVCKDSYVEETYGCKASPGSSGYSWIGIVFSIIGAMIGLWIFAVCIAKCRSAATVPSVAQSSNAPAPTAPPPVAVISDNPPSYDTVMSSNQQVTTTPPPLYNETNFSFPNFMQPRTEGVAQNPTHAGQTNRAFVNDAN